MKSSLIVAVLIWVLAVSQAQASTVQLQASLNTAAASLQQLNTVVRNVAGASLSLLNVLPGGLQAARARITDSVDAEITDTHNRLLWRVRILEAQADQAGIDIASCASPYKFELSILPRFVRSDINRCLDASLTQALNVTEGSISVIKNTENVAFRFGIMLEQCRIIEQQTCVHTTLQDIERETISLPVRVAEDTLITRNAVRALEAGLHSCSVDRVKLVSTVGTEIVDNIQNNCVRQ